MSEIDSVLAVCVVWFVVDWPLFLFPPQPARIVPDKIIADRTDRASHFFVLNPSF
jgi:hypothetical protein